MADVIDGVPAEAQTSMTPIGADGLRNGTEVPDEASKGIQSQQDENSQLVTGIGDGDEEVGNEDEDGDDEDEDDEEEDEDESKSRLAGNLKKDLEKTLSMSSTFRGKFAFASKLPSAPNPGLTISPLGHIGLPISERDAQALKAIASQAPFGHGDQLVVDTTVRHTWEIEPAKVITFANPAWASFVELVVKTACDELGVLPSSRPPKCDLYKLLLYESGSHFLPHRDTEKAPGMFATIVILLPSFYEGGQVYVSHGSEKQVFDFSSDAFATSMLTWYADVVHEVRPITSGYRLALTYNLIQEKSSLPLPSVPSMNPATIRLRTIFNNWSKADAHGEAPRRFAYVLDHEYSRVDLRLGEGALKGPDAQLLRTLRPIASEKGVGIAFAELECQIVGSADEEYGGYGYYNKRSRNRYDEDDEDEDEEDDEEDDDDDGPTIGEESSRTLAISSLTDLDGKDMVGKGSIALCTKELIPSNPFAGVDPDDEEYDGYMGNEPGEVQYWYRRIVLLLYLEKHAHDMLLEAGGTDYAIQQLDLSVTNDPSPLHQKFANYVVERLSSYHYVYMLGKDRQYTPYMFSLAIRWKDSALWLKIAYKIGAERDLGIIGNERLTFALETFGFEVLRPLFEKSVSLCASLEAQTKFIDGLPGLVKSDEEKVQLLTWCNEQKALALAHIKAPVKDDVPIIVDVMKAKGLQFFVDVIQPQLVQYDANFGFLMAFVRSLRDEKSSLCHSPTAEATYKSAVQFCLIMAISRFGHHENHEEVKEFIDTLLLMEQIEFCRTIFVMLIQRKGDINSKYKNTFTPLVLWLRHALNTRNIPLDSQPFGDFFRYLIETFLVSLLGARTAEMPHAVRKLGCGCQFCQELDRFLFSTDFMKQFRYNQTHRHHLERQISGARDIVTFTTIKQGIPHALEVRKSREIIAAATWEGRQKAAKKFLSLFGGEDAVRRIMGARYSDVARALSGERAYQNVAKPYSSSDLVPTTTIGAAQPSTSQKGPAVQVGAISQQVATSNLDGSRHVKSNVVAGTKRRKNLGFIDLSDSP